MQLNIKNARTVRLVNELTRVTGESLTGAVTTAVEERLERVRPAKRCPEEAARIIASVEALLEPLHASLREGPPVETQEAFDRWMYDEDGLPRRDHR